MMERVALSAGRCGSECVEYSGCNAGIRIIQLSYAPIFFSLTKICILYLYHVWLLNRMIYTMKEKYSIQLNIQKKTME